MASTRLALGSVLDTVVGTANALSSVVNTTTKSVGMLDAFVTKAADEQALQHKKDRKVFIKSLIREAAQEQAQADLKALEFCKKSDAHDKLYTEHLSEFEQLFATELGLQPVEA